MRSSQPLNLTTAPIAARSATGRSSFLVGKLKYFRGGILSLLKTPSQTSCHFFVSTTPDGRTSQTINARDQNDGNFHQIACTGSPVWELTAPARRLGRSIHEIDKT